VSPNESTISECYFTYKEDTLDAKFYPGKIVVDQEVFDNYIDTVNITLHLLHKKVCPNARKHNYQIDLKVQYLTGDYLILKLYNFSKKENRKKFREESGYGYDISSPYFSSFFPRKNKKRYKRNCY
jgi:hypothetical protein